MASRVVDLLKAHGATNIDGYVLINNDGYTFEKDGVRYDARFWRNCYGAEVYRWGVFPKWKELEDELNEIGEE
jgi:hypothetical protein